MTNSVLQKLGTLGPHFCMLFIQLFMGHLTKLSAFQNIVLEGTMVSE